MGEYFPQLFEERGLDFLAALPETRGEHDGDCGVHPCAFEHGDGDCQPDGLAEIGEGRLCQVLTQRKSMSGGNSG